MTTLAILSLAGSLFAVATPTSTYVHPAVCAARPTQAAHVTRQSVSDGRGQVWRFDAVPAKAPSAPAPAAHTFASLGK